MSAEDKTSKRRAEPVVNQSLGLDDLVEMLRRRARVPERDEAGPFFFAIDHCFPIRGQGTVVTGTALRGACRANDVVELPELGLEKKVKSMQMFRKAVKSIRCGDRAGLCLAQLDATVIERGIVATPGSVPGLSAALALVRRVRFFRGPAETERKFHVTLGHATTLATAYFFGAAELKGKAPPSSFDSTREYVYQELLAERPKKKGDDAVEDDADEPLQWCLLKFEAKVRCQLDALVIGSNLEANDLSDKCRIAFHGRLVERADAADVGDRVRLYKLKRKVGAVAKLGDPCVDKSGERAIRDVVGKDLFAKEANMNQFIGTRLQASTGEMGKIASAFGRSGKFKVAFDGPTLVKPGGKLYRDPRGFYDAATPPRRRREAATPPRYRDARVAVATPPRRRRDAGATPRTPRDAAVTPPRRRRDAAVMPPQRRRDAAAPPRLLASPPRRRRDTAATPRIAITAGTSFTRSTSSLPPKRCTRTTTASYRRRTSSSPSRGGRTRRTRRRRRPRMTPRPRPRRRRRETAASSG